MRRYPARPTAALACAAVFPDRIFAAHSAPNRPAFTAPPMSEALDDESVFAKKTKFMGRLATG
jgi:hypothetical protein